jgi:teichoic acid transport system permease protein
VSTSSTPRKAPGGPLVIDAARSGLHRIGSKPSLVGYVRQLWRFRNFIYFDSRSRLQSQNKSFLLGNVWLVLTPVFNGLTYFLIFGLLLQTSRGVDNFLGFLIIGVFMFSLTSRAISVGSRSLQQNKSVVSAFQFPRATLPLADNLRELLAFIPGFLAMVALVLVIPPMEPITWTWLLVIPVVFLQFCLNVGLSLLLARFVSVMNDLAQLIPFALRLWMYGSGVFYSFDRFVSNPQILAVLEFNPMHQVLTITRNAMLYDSPSNWTNWAILGGWAIASLAVGLVVFWSAEEKYGRVR